MKKRNYFEFKQFRVVQEKSAMKVGIDGILLGAWANFDNCKRILDVGTGTGLLSLMAAQQTDASIDAVEIDGDAFNEATFNFTQSPWADQLTIYKSSFQNFIPEFKYDHIICNPPFFNNSLKPIEDKRLKARHTDSLSLDELLTKAVSLLEENGKISLILPADSEFKLKSLIQEKALFISRICYVHPFKTKKPNRILVELRNMPCDLLSNKIIIRNEETNSYSEEYRELTKDFYRSLN